MANNKIISGSSESQTPFGDAFSKSGMSLLPRTCKTPAGLDVFCSKALPDTFCAQFPLPKPDRPNGDDSFYTGMICGKRKCLGVFDGVGGADSITSRLLGFELAAKFSKRISDYCQLNRVSDDTIIAEDRLVELLEATFLNFSAGDTSLEGKNKPGSTTFCFAFIQKNILTVINIGDSGASLYREGDLVKRSEDTLFGSMPVTRQTLPAQLYYNPSIGQDSTAHPVLGNWNFTLVESLGSSNVCLTIPHKTPFSIFSTSLEPGDTLLLFSDGLKNNSSKFLMTRAIKEFSSFLQDLVEALAVAAFDNGDYQYPDDITVMASRI